MKVLTLSVLLTLVLQLSNGLQCYQCWYASGTNADQFRIDGKFQGVKVSSTCGVGESPDSSLIENCPSIEGATMACMTFEESYSSGTQVVVRRCLPLPENKNICKEEENPGISHRDIGLVDVNDSLGKVNRLKGCSCTSNLCNESMHLVASMSLIIAIVVSCVLQEFVG